MSEALTVEKQSYISSLRFNDFWIAIRYRYRTNHQFDLVRQVLSSMITVKPDTILFKVRIQRSVAIATGDDMAPLSQ